MRAVAVGDTGRLEVVHKPEPVPGRADAVVAVDRCGICGSDLHLLASGLLRPGAVMGHEFAGTISAVGDAVSHQVAVGQRVAVLPAGRCGTCEACRAGRDNLCPAQPMTAIGLGVNDGGHAEYVRVPASSCHPLPPGMSVDHGALVEPYAVALHAVRRSAVPADPGAAAAVAVGVVGAGTIGLMCVAAARRAGVEQVAVAEPVDGRARVAESMGAALVDDADRLGRALTAPIDVVFDTTGVASTPAAAVEAVRAGGQVVLLGVVPPAVAIPMPGLTWLLKEVDVLTSIAYTTAEFADAVAHVGAGAVDAVAAAAQVRPLDEAATSFAELDGNHPPVKVLLAPRP